MNANEILEKLRPLLVSSKLEDLLDAKDQLIAEKENLKGEERARIGDEIARIMQSIEMAMDIDLSKLPKDADADTDTVVPTLDAQGSWKNADKIYNESNTQ